ncbi:MAG: choice-of-anchor tandem repeat GloVer-containing protein [Candidatus Acidiferrum sp.]
MTSRFESHGRISGRGWRAVSGALALVVMLLLTATAARAQESSRYHVLYAFTGTDGDGEFPLGSVIRDREGNLYGTTFNGGDLSGCFGAGCGVVFKVDPAGKETILYSFTGGADGANPAMGLLRDEAGNLYGTTHGGGDLSGNPVCSTFFGFPGCGVVFKVDPAGKETPLYAFTGGADGLGPASGLVRDREGNLYGTTGFGGNFAGDCPGEALPGCGVVFKLDATGKETVLHTFTGDADGYSPYGDLLLDAEGNLYGTAVAGADTSGTCSNVGGFLGCGTVYKLDRTGKFNVLHSFKGTDGAGPNGFLVRDHEGSLYGMTFYGGGLSACSGLGCGVVFKLDCSGKLTVLYSFTGGADGAAPGASVIRDADGNLYGTTNLGGAVNGSLCGGVGCGVVFKLDATGKETVLHVFTGAMDGANPDANLLLDEERNLYSTAVGGGDLSCSPTYGCGVVFKFASHEDRESDESAAPVASSEAGKAALTEDAPKQLQQNLRRRYQIGGPQ